MFQNVPTYSCFHPNEWNVLSNHIKSALTDDTFKSLLKFRFCEKAETAISHVTVFLYQFHFDRKVDMIADKLFVTKWPLANNFFLR